MTRMSRIARSLPLCSALLLSACATIPRTPPGASMETADRQQMLAAVNASAAAWNRGDLRGHLAIYDETITMMTKSGPRPTIAAIESSFRATYFAGDRPKQNLRMERIEIRPLAADVAMMTGRFVLSGGGEAEQSGWFTLIWIRTATGWRVVHDHSS